MCYQIKKTNKQVYTKKRADTGGRRDGLTDGLNKLTDRLTDRQTARTTDRQADITRDRKTVGHHDRQTGNNRTVSRSLVGSSLYYHDYYHKRS